VGPVRGRSSKGGKERVIIVNGKVTKRGLTEKGIEVRPAQEGSGRSISALVRLPPIEGSGRGDEKGDLTVDIGYRGGGKKGVKKGTNIYDRISEGEKNIQGKHAGTYAKLADIGVAEKGREGASGVEGRLAMQKGILSERQGRKGR